MTARNAWRILAIINASIRLSNRLLSPIKTMQATITKSSLPAAQRTLEF